MTEPFQSRSPLRFTRGELVFGYRLVRKLGEGSFGSVWLAANEKGFEWALKFVSLQGNGGLKEFKALQLIKDRKINNTNLLKLIDYGLLDHDGNSLATSTSSPLLTAPNDPTPPNNSDRAEPANPSPSQGTLMPVAEKAANRTEVEKLATRETQGDPGDTKTSDKNRASWLVIVMEVGQSTLHQLQLQQTQRDLSDHVQSSRAVTRMGATAARSHTLKDDEVPTPHDIVEEPLSPLPVALVLPYMEQAARGLDYLHRNDIVHRDIKPQNIILVGDDAKLCDYGLASEFTNSTATTIGCTPAYAAPEAINNRPVPASDQYSLAVTYIELVTGRWPFFGITQTAIYREKDEGRHNLAFIPKRNVRTVLKRALSKTPEDRFPTCVEFMQKLAVAENSSPGLLSRGPLVTAAITLLAVSLAVIGWMYQSEDWRLGRANANQNAKRGPEELPLEIPAGDPDPGVAPSPTKTAANESPKTSNATPPTQLPVADPESELTAAFANANLPLRDLLPIFENCVAATADPPEWFIRLREKANATAANQTAVEQWLRKNLNRTPRLPTLESAEYQAFDQEFRAASLQRLWTRQLQTPADFDAALRSDALKLNDADPLAVLLRVDLEMRLAGAAAQKSQREDWDGRIQSALLPPLAGQPAAQRELFVTYLNALQLTFQPANVNLRELGDRLQTLLNTSPQPTWLTADRKEQLAEPLGMVAIHELAKQDRDLLEIEQWNLDSNNRLKYLLTIAELHGLESNSLAAVQALVRTSQALRKKTVPAAEWQAIAALADTAFNDTPTYDFCKSQNCRQLLFYVYQRGKLETAAPNSDDLRRAVIGFAVLLQAKSPIFFDFEQPSQPQDSGVFRHLVQPPLNHPAVVAGSSATQSSATQFDPETLALLWGAKGRLLQRSPVVMDLVEPATRSKLSKPVQTLLLAQQAFAKAARYEAKDKRKFGEAAASVLAALPKAVNPQSTPLADLIAIVDAADPGGVTEDAELLRLGAYVRRQQSYLEADARRRSDFAQQAISHYGRVIALATKPESRSLLAPACVELSELHLKLAEGVELKKTDYDQLADQPQQPPPGTKSYHLWRAAALAKQALSAGNDALRTSASLVLATAYEQMAYALGLVAQYERAIEVLDGELVRTANAPLERSLVQATRARCRMRQAQEIFNGLPPEACSEKLLMAVADFDAALGDRRTTKQWIPQDAETLYCLAETQITLATQSEAERAQRLAQAETALRTAIEVADPHSPRLSQYRWRLLLVLSSQATQSSRSAQKFADEAFAASSIPTEQDPVAVVGIALATARLFPEPSKLLRWLPASGPLHQQWRTTDSWKLEGARLYSEAALLHSSTELRRSPQQLALEIPPGSPQRLLAEAALQDNLARQFCREFERLKPPSSSPATQIENQQRSYEGDRLVKAGMATAAIRECCQKHWNCQEERIQSLLAEIGRTSLADLKEGKCLTGATVLEKRALWKYATTAPALESRDKYLEMCLAHASLAQGGDIANRDQLAKTTQDLLKPVVFFSAQAERDVRLNAFLQKHKALLESEAKKK